MTRDFVPRAIAMAALGLAPSIARAHLVNTGLGPFYDGVSHFVLTAEEMVIKDTEKAAELFARFDVPLSGYIMNRILPESLKTAAIPEYLKNRIAMQERYLRVIDERFKGQILAMVPEMERDVTGLPMIEKMAAAMFGPPA
jgi:anion-transporting  ArsA/GET3 family ATPase